MSIVKSLKKRRNLARAEIKAAKTRARAEVKAHSKEKLRQQKLLAKHEKELIKSEEKGLKARRKHEEKIAKTELKKIQEGRFNSSNVKRYAGAARVAAPLLLPLIYRGIIAAKEALEARRAQRAGVSKAKLGVFAGEGAPLKAQIDTLRDSLDTLELPTGFQKDVKERLDELETSVNNAEIMPPQQRRRAFSSISDEINAASSEIHQKSKK